MKNIRQAITTLPSHPKYSEAFKRKVVAEIEQGSVTREGARRKYGIGGAATVDQWCRKYGRFERLGVKITVESAMKRDEKRELKERVRQLEAALADEKLKTMVLEKLIDVAERDLHVSIRKKSGSKQ